MKTILMFLLLTSAKHSIEQIICTALWYKLHDIDVNSKIIFLLKDMYSKMKIGVKSSVVNFSNDFNCYCVNEIDIEATYCTKSINAVNNSCYYSPQAGVFQGQSLCPLTISIFNVLE